MADEQVRVMIVDDEQGIVDFMQKILALKGYRTSIAMESNKALEVFRAERPQICILDVHLSYSPLDGVQLLSELRKIDPSAKCIMVSRITDEEKIKEAMTLGAVEYLLKPVDTRDLITQVNKLAQPIKEGQVGG